MSNDVINTESPAPSMGAELAMSAGLLQGYQAINDGLNTQQVDGRSFISSSSAFSYLLTGLTAVGSALNLLETWDSLKDLYHAKNKNFEKVARVGVNLFRSVVLGLFWGSLITGATLALPYLVPIAAGIGTVWELYHVAKKARQAYKAYKAKDDEQRNHALRGMATHIFGTILNGLSMGASIIVTSVSSSFKKAADMFADGQKHGNLGELGAAGDLASATDSTFNNFKPYAYVMSVSAIAKMFMQPITFREIGQRVMAKAQAAEALLQKHPFLGIPVVLVGAILEAVNTVVSSVVRLAQIAIKGLVMTPARSIKKMFFTKKEERVRPQPIVRCPTSDPLIIKAFLCEEEKKEIVKQKEIADAKCAADQLAKQQQKDELNAQYQQLKNLLAEQKARLATKPDNNKNIAKAQFVTKLAAHLGSNFEEYQSKKSQDISGLVTEAEKMSPLLQQSFFRLKGRTEQIIEASRALEAKMTDFRAAP